MGPLRSGVGGIVLAAGAGQRYGGPKALVTGWLADRVAALVDGGCARVVVVLGAQADAAKALVPRTAEVAVAVDWAEGMGASLRAGLDAADRWEVDAVLVALVDVPGLTSQVVARLLAASKTQGTGVLVRATYDGRHGHPVLLGRDHWPGVTATAVGDRGARDYLRGRPVLEVECGDLTDGVDVDRPMEGPRPGPA